MDTTALSSDLRKIATFDVSDRASLIAELRVPLINSSGECVTCPENIDDARRILASHKLELDIYTGDVNASISIQHNGCLIKTHSVLCRAYVADAYFYALKALYNQYISKNLFSIASIDKIHELSQSQFGLTFIIQCPAKAFYLTLQNNGLCSRDEWNQFLAIFKNSEFTKVNSYPNGIILCINKASNTIKQINSRDITTINIIDKTCLSINAIRALTKLYNNSSAILDNINLIVGILDILLFKDKASLDIKNHAIYEYGLMCRMPIQAAYHPVLFSLFLALTRVGYDLVSDDNTKILNNYFDVENIKNIIINKDYAKALEVYNILRKFLAVSPATDFGLSAKAICVLDFIIMMGAEKVLGTLDIEKNWKLKNPIDEYISHCGTSCGWEKFAALYPNVVNLIKYYPDIPNLQSEFFKFARNWQFNKIPTQKRTNFWINKGFAKLKDKPEQDLQLPRMQHMRTDIIDKLLD